MITAVVGLHFSVVDILLEGNSYNLSNTDIFLFLVYDSLHLRRGPLKSPKSLKGELRLTFWPAGIVRIWRFKSFQWFWNKKISQYIFRISLLRDDFVQLECVKHKATQTDLHKGFNLWNSPLGTGQMSWSVNDEVYWRSYILHNLETLKHLSTI